MPLYHWRGVLCLKYESIVFDVSDTLIEYRPNYAKIYGDRLRDLGFEISEEKAIDVSKAINWAIGEQTRKEEFGEPKISAESYKTMLDDAALLCMLDEEVCRKEHLIELSKIPIPEQEMIIISDAIKVLTALKSKYRLAIVSNHYSWLMDYLHESKLAPFFESIVISDIVGVAKPNIQIMQIVLEELNLKAENVFT